MTASSQNMVSRLEARLPREVYTLLKRAADIEGRSLTDFVVSAAREAARRTVRETEILQLTADDQRLFAGALLTRKALNPALKRARKNHGRLIGPE